MREIAYQICDVFTARPFEGNQLAVVLDGNHLTDAEMQALARETNLSETTFLCRRDAATERERGIRVRIFTTQEELPFAGHPTLGTATVVRTLFPEFQGAETIVLDLNAGPVQVVFSPEENTGRVAFGMMTQPQPVFGKQHVAAEIGPLLGLRTEDLLADHPPQTVSTGLPFCVVPLKSVEALSRMRVQAGPSEEYFLRSAANEEAQAPHAKFFYAIAAAEPGTWRARMQFYNGEDPATGSAAGCAISYLVRHGLVVPGERVHLRQGIEIHRPSDLYISANLPAGEAGEVRVGGSTVLVAKGRFFLE